MRNSFRRPVAGSQSERRALQAAARINAEVAVLCDMIYQEGEKYPDGTAAITFGDLFQVRWVPIAYGKYFIVQ